MKLFKTRKGKLSLLLLFAIVLQLVGPVVGDMAFADGGDPVSLEKIELKFDGKTLVEWGDDLIPEDAEVNFKLGFTIKDDAEVDITKNYEMQLPEQIKLSKEYNIKLELNELDDDGNPVLDEDGNPVKEQVGTAIITQEGNTTIKFNDKINDYDTDRLVWVEASGSLDKDKLDDDNETEIEFEFQDKTEIFKITTKSFELNESITLKKTGSAYNNSTHQITWTITGTPKTNAKDGKIKNVTIVDTLPDGQTYVSSKVGRVDATPGQNDQELTFDIGEVENGKDFVIEVVTESDVSAFTNAAEDSELSFTNKVKGTFGEPSKPITEVPATVKTKVDYINKKGEFVRGDTRDKDRIKWTINLNNNNLNLTESLKLADTIPAGLELDTTKGIEIKDAKGAGFEASKYTLTGNGFPITFPNGLDEKVTITYYTKITDPSAYNPDVTSSYANSATLTGAGGDRTDTGTEGIGKTVISKSGDGYDANNHYVKWKITVNGSKMDLVNPLVTDTLDPRLEYVSHTISPNSTGWTFAQSGDNLTFSYDGTITDTYTINIVTKIKEQHKGLYGANKTTTFNNQAKISGDNVSEKSTENKTQNYTSKVIEKTNTGYDYTTRKASWKIVVNQNNMKIDNAIVTDRIGENHVFVKGSLKLGENLIPEGSSGSTKPYYTINGQELKIYLGDITGEQTLIFETEIPEDKIDDVFGNENKNIVLENSATITGEQIKAGGETSIASKTVNNTMVAKAAKYEQGDDFIDWEVIINSNLVKLGDITLEDTLDEKLELDISTVKLYKITYDKDGKYTVGTEEEPIEKSYDPTTNKVEFKIKGVKEAYILKFTTDIKGDKASGNISNTINLKGGKKEYDSNEAKVQISFDNASGGASGSKTRGSIKIIKSFEERELIAGIRFQLLDIDKNPFEPAIVEETNEDGIVMFDNLRMGKYYIEEVNPPEGYEKMGDLELTLVKGLDTKHIKEEVKNILIRNSFYFIKKGNRNDEPLKGAEFTLYHADKSEDDPITYTKGDKYGDSVLSDEDGLVEFKDVPYGKYILVETKAPSSYRKSNAEVLVEVKTTDEGTGVIFSLLDKDGVIDEPDRLCENY